MIAQWPSNPDPLYRPSADSPYWNAELEKMDPEKRNEEVILPKLQAQIAYAYKNSAFYRKKWDSAGIKPDDIRSLEDFESLPLVTKEEITAGSRRLSSFWKQSVCSIC